MHDFCKKKQLTAEFAENAEAIQGVRVKTAFAIAGRICIVESCLGETPAAHLPVRPPKSLVSSFFCGKFSLWDELR
jgi:hypothetical protein